MAALLNGGGAEVVHARTPSLPPVKATPPPPPPTPEPVSSHAKWRFRLLPDRLQLIHNSAAVKNSQPEELGRRPCACHPGVKGRALQKGAPPTQVRRGIEPRTPALRADPEGGIPAPRVYPGSLS